MKNWMHWAGMVAVLALLALVLGGNSATGMGKLEGTLWRVDPAYGVNGFVVFDPLPGWPYFEEIQEYRAYPQPDGSVVVYVRVLYAVDRGSGEDEILVRFDPSGAATEVVGAYSIRPVGVQSDGKLLALDWTEFNEPYLVRYNPDLSIDASFVMTDSQRLTGTHCCFAVQPDDRILFTTPNNDVARLEPDGTLDASLLVSLEEDLMTTRKLAGGSNGRFLVHQGLGFDECSARVFEGDGALLNTIISPYTGGTEHHCTFVFFVPYPDGGYVWTELGVRVYKTLPDGTPDLAFGEGGMVELLTWPESEYPDLYLQPVVQPDGKILLFALGGYGGNAHAFIFRLNPDGTPDRSFADSGRLWIAQPLGSVKGLFVQSDGSLLVAGATTEHLVLFRLEETAITGRVYLPTIGR